MIIAGVVVGVLVLGYYFFFSGSSAPPSQFALEKQMHGPIEDFGDYEDEEDFGEMPELEPMPGQEHMQNYPEPPMPPPAGCDGGQCGIDAPPHVSAYGAQEGGQYQQEGFHDGPMAANDGGAGYQSWQ